MGRQHLRAVEHLLLSLLAHLGEPLVALCRQVVALLLRFRALLVEQGEKAHDGRHIYVNQFERLERSTQVYGHLGAMRRQPSKAPTQFWRVV